jgi:transposase
MNVKRKELELESNNWCNVYSKSTTIYKNLLDYQTTKTFAVGYMSKIRAETNPTSKAVSNAEYRLNQFTSNKRPTPPSKSKRPCKQRKWNYPVSANKLEMFHSTTKPKDGQLFTVYEIIFYMLVNECSFLFGQPINLVHKYLTDKSAIGFGRTTLQKAVKNYKEKGILPRKNSDGMKVGRPPLIEKENIQQLNNRLHNNVGLVGGSSSLLLTQDLLELSNQQRIVRGIDTSFEKHTISSATKKLHNHEASVQPGISLVKPSSTKVQGSRRQTAASSSHRNVMSQIATLLNFNFVRGGEWTNKPTNLSEGAKFAHRTIERVTGHPMRPAVPTDHTDLQQTTEIWKMNG